jgi:hypothetical protein
MRLADALELDTFKRDIHLVEYATTRHGYRRDRRESSVASHVLRQPQTDDKIVVGRDKDQHWIYFSIRDERDNGTIIDFVQRRGMGSLGATRAELRQWLGSSRPDPGPDIRPETRPVTRDRLAVATLVAQLPEPQPTNSPYLNARGIRPETLRDPRFAGTWKIDARGNTIFLHRDAAGVSGFEIKNTTFTGFSKHGEKTAWQSVVSPPGSANVVVLTETAIDALSYAQLHGASTGARLEPEGTVYATGVHYLSTAGSLSPRQHELLDTTIAALPDRSVVVAAYDNDAAGQNLAATIAEVAAAHRHRALRVHRHAPPCEKDWNAHLQRLERNFLRSLPPSIRALAPSNERSR